jgi:hypothetical protein
MPSRAVMLLLLLCCAFICAQNGLHSQSVSGTDQVIFFTDVTTQRREAVKQEFIDAWKAYETFAFGSDELRPLSKSVL